MRLTSETRARWGTMAAGRMLCHVADSLDAGLGSLAVPRGGPAAFRHFPLKQLALYVVPMPKGAKAPPQLFARQPGGFEAERQRVLAAMKLAAAAPAGPGPEHFLLGRMTNNQWNVLHWKHIDHHLRQFGC